MKHIYETIEGWFTFPELYKNIISIYGNNSHFVEVGTWLGKSASFMAVEIINSGKTIKFDCVDTWKGSEEHINEKVVLEDNLYESFLINIEPVKNIINPIRKPSIEASTLYEDNSLDFVFLDAAHDYVNVKNDIDSWYPKVKSGGVLAGHDYTASWVGVVDAVNDFLKTKKYSLYINQEGCWGILKR
jgi:hypothetical protein